MKVLLIRIIVFNILTYFFINSSVEIDLEQFKDDLEVLKLRNYFNQDTIVILLGVFVAFLSSVLINIFKPFIEIYLLYFQKISFYFLINLLSISTVFIVLRVYGYSRFYLLIYLLTGTIALHFIDKIKFN